MSFFARTPEPPYYAVIFSSRRSPGDHDGYAQTAARMVELAGQQPGFLGAERARGEDGCGITVSYWDSEESIACWKAQHEHLTAQQEGRQQWYEAFEVRVARVERAYGKQEDSD